ncbi:MAG: hypothetical protein ABIV47_12400 [Roseiflexaceae bacterium]
MDAMTLFPALLALMVAALTGLGYALYQLANTSGQFTLPPTHMEPCTRCGGSMVGGQSHCLLCGAAHEPLTEASSLLYRSAQETSSRAHVPRS